jgi:trehalose-phosphatase
MLDSFFDRFRGHTHPVLLLDYDGTLAGFRVDRFQARPWAGVRQLLQQIQSRGRTRMVVISGRPAAEIAPLLRLEPPLEAWGLHGAERLYPDGRRELQQAPPATQAKLEQLKQSLRHDSLGGLFEDKANGAVMHWRGHSRKTAEQIERRTRELFEPLAHMEGLALLEFESGLELRAGRDKGGAVDAILAERGTTGPVAYLGDDLTDETAFRAVNRAAPPHVSGLVRRAWRETAADLWLRPPADVREFLELWLRATDSVDSQSGEIQPKIEM